MISSFMVASTIDSKGNFATRSCCIRSQQARMMLAVQLMFPRVKFDDDVLAARIESNTQSVSTDNRHSQQPSLPSEKAREHLLVTGPVAITRTSYFQDAIIIRENHEFSPEYENKMAIMGYTPRMHGTVMHCIRPFTFC
jgi:hypothetical protein